MSDEKSREQAKTSGVDLYALSRGETASTRLNALHYLFKGILGFNIHPSLLKRDGRTSLRVADVGTCTGIWAVDVHRQPELMGLLSP